MRTLKRNKRPFYYANPVKETMIPGQYDGLYSGEVSVTYTTPVMMKANISPASGSAQAEAFGTLTDYDKVIVTDDIDCPIDEHTVLFIDVLPPQWVDTNGAVRQKTILIDTNATREVLSTENDERILFGDHFIQLKRPSTDDLVYDYIVKRVAKSLNSVSIAISKVDLR